MSAIVLPIIGLVLVWSAVNRYRGDSRALVAGTAAATGGTLGASLVVPEINQSVPFWLLLTLGGMAIAVAVIGSIYAEVRLKRRITQEPADLH